MSKERLEEIKEHYGKHFHKYECVSTIENINWLIEQAERVQELEEELAIQKELRKKRFFDLYKTKKMYSEVKNNYIRECKQNKRYREALEAIAYSAEKPEGNITTRVDARYIASKVLKGEE